MKHRTIALAALLTALAASPAIAGPPWISVEFRPHAGSFLWLRTHHHGAAQPMTLTGTAEGLVNGRRVSVPLRFEGPQDGNGYGVAKAWGDEGVWVLNMSTPAPDHGGAGVVVGVDSTGNSVWVRFPRHATGVTRAATPAEVDRLLQALKNGQQPPALARTGWLWVIGRALLPLVVLTTIAAVILKSLEFLVRRFKARRAVAAQAAHSPSSVMS